MSNDSSIATAITAGRGGAANLAELTWQEYERRVGTSLLVLPVGGVETHGAHLPLNTDTLIAEYLAENLADRIGALILPTVHYGVRANPVRLGGEFPGNVDVAASTFIDYVTGILTAAYHDGARNFLMLFATYSNGPFLQEAMKHFIGSAPGARVMAASWWHLVTDGTRDAIATQTGVPRSEDHHSGLVETSLVMHISPGSLRKDLICDEKPTRRASYAILPMPTDLATPTGIVYRARNATAEIGQWVADEVMANLVAAVSLEFEFELPHPGKAPGPPSDTPFDRGGLSGNSIDRP